MTKLNLTGVFPPMITPFTKEEEVDYDGHIYNVQKWNKVQLGGYVVLGSNSETVYLNEEEKLKLIDLTVKNAAPGRKIIVGTGLESTKATIALTNAAAAKGVHAALIITPFYYLGKMNDAALIHHFEMLADQSEIPILVYNVSKFTHINVSTNVISKLSQHPNIIGMKDSSGSIPQLIQYQNAAKGDFQILSGTASIWYPALNLGVKGAVMALGNCAPQACVDIQNAFERGNLAEAEAIYRRMFPVNAAVTAQFGIAGLKYASELCGYKGGSVRSPLQPLETLEKEEIRRILAKARLIENLIV